MMHIKSALASLLFMSTISACGLVLGDSGGWTLGPEDAGSSSIDASDGSSHRDSGASTPESGSMFCGFLLTTPGCPACTNGCNTCVSQHCCAQDSACGGDHVCTLIDNCAENCAVGDMACATACAMQWSALGPQHQQTWSALVQCVTENCTTQCPGWSAFGSGSGGGGCPSGCQQGGVCCGGAFCAGHCVGTPCCP